jgi:hypothetical protein
MSWASLMAVFQPLAPVCKCAPFILDGDLDICDTPPEMATIDKYVLMYRQTIDDLSAALETRAALEEQLEEVRNSIQQLREIAYSTSAYRGLDPKAEYPSLFIDGGIVDVGFTDAVRATFKPGKAMTAIQVRNDLINAGFDLDGYRNPLATIHTILKRLVKSGELFIGPSFDDEDDDGPTVYIMPPADTIAVAKRVTEKLKKKRPAWAKYLAEHGGLILAEPPYFASGKPLTVRQQREVRETLAAENVNTLPSGFVKEGTE